MFLRDLFLRRKPGGTGHGAPTVALVVPEMAAAPVLPTPEEAADRAEVLHLGPFSDASDIDAPDPDQAEVPEAKAASGGLVRRRQPSVLRRMEALTISGTEAEAARQDAVIERLGIVHDPNEVVLSGADRTARIVMANRRLMAARFTVAGQGDAVFSFASADASPEAEQGLAASLTAFCAAPVDLVVTERAISGVFDAAAGLAMEDIAAGPERAALARDGVDLEATAG